MAGAAFRAPGIARAAAVPVVALARGAFDTDLANAMLVAVAWASMDHLVPQRRLGERGGPQLLRQLRRGLEVDH